MKNKMYETSDLGLASYLEAKGLRIIFIGDDTDYRTGKDKKTFCFEQAPKLNRLIDEYLNRRGLVEPQAYWEAMRSVKNRLYNV